MKYSIDILYDLVLTIIALAILTFVGLPAFYIMNKLEKRRIKT